MDNDDAHRKVILLSKFLYSMLALRKLTKQQVLKALDTLAFRMSLMDRPDLEEAVTCFYNKCKDWKAA